MKRNINKIGFARTTRQSGETFIGFMCIIGLLLVLGYIAYAIGPLFYEKHNIKNTINDYLKSVTHGVDSGDPYTDLLSFFERKNVRTIDNSNIENTVFVDDDSGYVTVIVEHSVSSQLIGGLTATLPINLTIEERPI